MKEISIYDNSLATPFDYAMSAIEGKWKLRIVYVLKVNSVMRYSELKKVLTRTDHKTLCKKLKELEDDKLIIRKEYPQIPPKVEYSLSEKGLALSKVMKELCDWGHIYINNNSS